MVLLPAAAVLASFVHPTLLLEQDAHRMEDASLVPAVSGLASERQRRIPVRTRLVRSALIAIEDAEDHGADVRVWLPVNEPTADQQ